MKIASALLLTVLTGANSLAATLDSDNKHFAVQPGGKIVVDIDFGEIQVSTNTSSEVSIEYYRTITGGSEDKASEFLAERPVVISQDGNTITIVSKKKSKLNWSWPSFKRTEAKYTIRVPSMFSANLNTSGGSIGISDLTGEFKANTSGGGLNFARLNGPLKADTSGGSIKVLECKGELKVDTSGGGIHVDGGSGNLHGDTSGGSISVRSFKGDAHVHTSGGGITVENVAGKVVGSTSGGSISATLPSPLPGPLNLDTSGGGITLVAPSTAAFHLNASTSAGGVSCELPITIAGKHERELIKGDINGGGPEVMLRTSAGSIKVKKS